MLKELKINKNEITVDYPRFKNFKLKMRYVPRDELSTLREKHSTISFNRASRAREESVDFEKFIDSYIKQVIAGWSGLTFEIVQALVPIEVSEAELTKEVPYTHEDALWLVKNSNEFDTFVTDTMSQVDLFSVTNKEAQLKK